MFVYKLLFFFNKINPFFKGLINYENKKIKKIKKFVDRNKNL